MEEPVEKNIFLRKLKERLVEKIDIFLGISPEDEGNSIDTDIVIFLENQFENQEHENAKKLTSNIISFLT